MNLLYLYIVLLASPSLISGKKDKDGKQCMLQNQLKKLALRMDALEDKVSEPPACSKSSGVVELQAQLRNQSMEIKNVEDKLSGELLTLSAQARHNVGLIYKQIITSGDIVPIEVCRMQRICKPVLISYKVRNETRYVKKQVCSLGAECDNVIDQDLNTVYNITTNREMEIGFGQTVNLKSVVFVRKTHESEDIELIINQLGQKIALPLRAEGLYLETFDLQNVTTDRVRIRALSENQQSVEWAEVNFFQTNPV